MNLLTLPLVNPRHHIGKLKRFTYVLFEDFMRAYFDADMKLLYPSCLVRKRHDFFVRFCPASKCQKLFMGKVANKSFSILVVCLEYWQEPFLLYLAD